MNGLDPNPDRLRLLKGECQRLKRRQMFNSDLNDRKLILGNTSNGINVLILQLGCCISALVQRFTNARRRHWSKLKS